MFLVCCSHVTKHFEVSWTRPTESPWMPTLRSPRVQTSSFGHHRWSRLTEVLALTNSQSSYLAAHFILKNVDNSDVTFNLGTYTCTSKHSSYPIQNQLQWRTVRWQCMCTPLSKPLSQRRANCCWKVSKAMSHQLWIRCLCPWYHCHSYLDLSQRLTVMQYIVQQKITWRTIEEVMGSHCWGWSEITGGRTS